MECNRPKKGEFYRHFKGNEYEILAIAKHSETLEEMVVYQALYGEQEVYVRPLSMFMETVNGQPRFSLVETMGEEEQSLLITFLDFKTASEKIEFLQAKKNELDNNFMNLAAQCLDFTETKTEFEDRFYDLIKYLRTLEKYEGER